MSHIFSLLSLIYNLSCPNQLLIMYASTLTLSLLDLTSSLENARSPIGEDSSSPVVQFPEPHGRLPYTHTETTNVQPTVQRHTQIHTQQQTSIFQVSPSIPPHTHLHTLTYCPWFADGCTPNDAFYTACRLERRPSTRLWRINPVHPRKQFITKTKTKAKTQRQPQSSQHKLVWRTKTQPQPRQYPGHSKPLLPISDEHEAPVIPNTKHLKETELFCTQIHRDALRAPCADGPQKTITMPETQHLNNAVLLNAHPTRGALRALRTGGYLPPTPIPKMTQLNKTELLCTQLNSGALRAPQTKGGRQHQNPNHKLILPPKKTPNRISRTHASKNLNAIRTTQSLSLKHQRLQTYTSPSSTFFTSLNSTSLPSERFALWSLAVSLYSPRTGHHEHLSTATHRQAVNSNYRGAAVGRDYSALGSSGPGFANTVNHRRSELIGTKHLTLNSRSRGRRFSTHSNTRIVQAHPLLRAYNRREADSHNNHQNHRGTCRPHPYTRYQHLRSLGPPDTVDPNDRRLNPGQLGNNPHPLQLQHPEEHPGNICGRRSQSGCNEGQFGVCKHLRPDPSHSPIPDSNTTNFNNRYPSVVHNAHRHSHPLPSPEDRHSTSTTSRARIHPRSGRTQPSKPQTTSPLPSPNGPATTPQFIPGPFAGPLAVTPHRHTATATKPTAACRNSVQLPHFTTLTTLLPNLRHSSKSPTISQCFKAIFLFKNLRHNSLHILSTKSNPCYAWGTYAPRRAPAFISKNFALHTTHSLPPIHKHHLLVSKNTPNKKYQIYSIIIYSICYCLQLLPDIMAGATKPHTRHHNSNNTTEVVMEDVTPPSKRSSPNSVKASHKKSKSTTSSLSLYRDPSQMEFWYGYPIMETIAYEAGIPPIPIATPLDELIATGYVASEAAELCSATISFPRVQQKLWPTTRPDGIEGQHVNITQLPFDIEVNPKSHLSLDYHILLHFEKPINPFSQDQIMKKLLMRFQTMDIQLGDLIGEPIAVLCHGPKNARVWSGMAKVHLKHPSKDGIALLSGGRIFAITLDNDVLTIAKVAKSYDPLAPSNQLTVKINTDNIRDLVAHQLFKAIVEESFKRGHEFELTQVQKTAGESYGWLITTSPEQVEKLGRNKIPILGELLTPVISSGDQLSRDDVVRRNCLVLLAKGLNLTKLIEPTTASLHDHFGTKNIVSVFYPRATTKIHHGVANIECLNSAVYKQHLNKSARIHNKWVMFHPHPNSLDGSAKPDEATLKKLGFTDVHNALADTIEALKNAPGPSHSPLDKSDIATLVKDVVSKENHKLRTEFKADMTLLRTDMRTEAQSYADQINFDLRSALTNLEQVLGQSMQVVKNLVRPSLLPADSPNPPSNL